MLLRARISVSEMLSLLAFCFMVHQIVVIRPYVLFSPNSEQDDYEVIRKAGRARQIQ